jgi:hypothetical protein
MSPITFSALHLGHSFRQLIAKAKQELPDASREKKVIELIETMPF